MRLFDFMEDKKPKEFRVTSRLTQTNVEILHRLASMTGRTATGMAEVILARGLQELDMELCDLDAAEYQEYMETEEGGDNDC